jgi:hypothetical protein
MIERLLQTMLELYSREGPMSDLRMMETLQADLPVDIHDVQTLREILQDRQWIVERIDLKAKDDEGTTVPVYGLSTIESSTQHD